jgi:hypothetical protein
LGSANEWQQFPTIRAGATGAVELLCAANRLLQQLLLLQVLQLGSVGSFVLMSGCWLQRRTAPQTMLLTLAA